MRDFIIGMAGCFDLFGFLEPRREDYPSLSQSDAENLRSDWDAIGRDMAQAPTLDFAELGGSIDGRE